MYKTIPVTDQLRNVYKNTYTKNFSNWCGAVHPTPGHWVCSRLSGHKCKRHIAHLGNGYIKYIWEN
jgi:hypothetical protein